MNKKIKIIAIFFAIALITGIFCITAFADYEQYEGIVIPANQVLTFNGTLNITHSPDKQIRFRSYSMRYNDPYVRMFYSSNRLYYDYFTSGTNQDTAYNNGWSTGKNQIWFLNDYTIDNSEFSKFLIDNVIDGLPEPPSPPPSIEPTLWENVQDFFDSVLDNGTLIVTWITDTPIALIPLALYCVIVIFAIFKRFVKG